MTSRVLVVLLLAGLLILFAVPGEAADFYTNLLERGITEFQGGQMNEAARLLRIASFGLLESLDRYETSQVYLAIAQDRLGNDVEARQAITNVFRAEQIAPTYRALSISPAVRSSFEKVLARLMPDYRPMADAKAPTPTPQPAAAVPVPTPKVIAPPAPPIPQPAPMNTPEPVATTNSSASTVPVSSSGATSVEIKDLEALIEKQPESNSITLALSDAHLRAGNLAEARAYAERVIGRDPSNAVAHTYLARVAVRQQRCDEAIEHYSSARSSISLGDDDEAALFVCYVETHNDDKAHEMRAGLSTTVLARPAVAQALKDLERRGAPSGETGTSSPDPPTVRNQASTPDASSPSPPTREDIFVSVRQARDLAASGDCDGAVTIYRRVLAVSELERFVLLALGQGLGSCGSFRSSIEAYSRAQPLQAGEEDHMFRVAVDLYETGSYQAAREYLKRALQKIEVTREVAEYKERIEGRK